MVINAGGGVDVRGDDGVAGLAQRRHQVTGTGNLAGGMMVVQGTVPLSELDGYSGRLKAITQGQGSFSMELSHYEAVPPGVQQQLATDFKSKRKTEEED